MTKRVLIVDDEENIRRMMRLALETAGYEIGEACDGAQGLETYGDGSHWDGVLLDERMPGMDGLETLRRLKERDADARVIMVTAYASIELAVEAMKAGATDFVRKPTTPEILRGALQATLSKQTISHVTPKAAATGTSEPTQPRIQTITLNGFEIIRPTEKAEIPTKPDEHRFIIKGPDGKESPVIVKIDAEAVNYVERLTRRRLPAGNSFWIFRAERFLGDYLWNEGKLPPGGRLTVKEVDREALLVAERWEGMD